MTFIDVNIRGLETHLMAAINRVDNKIDALRAENAREHEEMRAENAREHEEMRAENALEHEEMKRQNALEHEEMKDMIQEFMGNVDEACDRRIKKHEKEYHAFAN